VTYAEPVTTKLREMLRVGEQVIAPGVYDALSAKVVVSLGFNGVYLGGGATSASLGTIEPLMTMSEQIGLAARVAAAIGDVPLIVDGHTGFGDAPHITRAVREFEAAGVAAIHIEDQPFPKRVSYHKGIKHMVSVEEMQNRIRAACRARRNPDFLIIARTEARGAVGGSLEQAIERLRAYSEAGADVVMPMPHGRAEAERVREGLPDTPLMWFAGLGSYAPGEEVHVDDLKALGYQIVAYPVVGFVRAINAVTDLYSDLKQRGVVDIAGLDDGSASINELIEVPAYYEIEVGAGKPETATTH
jgi:2-methylisocitrate lyase-like PEP mutase family enzyme